MDYLPPYILGIAITLFASCTQSIPVQIPYHRDPETPSLAALQAISKIDASALERHQVFDEAGEGIQTFSLDGELFTGWAYFLHPDTDHRYRFIFCKAGKIHWQVGYYDNGQLDHDFHMKADKSFGSERMWNKNGRPYIDYFYDPPGEMDGVQYRWHGNGVLAREGLYKKGEMVYEVIFDKEGRPIEKKGKVPEKWDN